MRSQLFASTRRLLGQPSSRRLPLSFTSSARSLTTLRSTSSIPKHTSLCRCASCSASTLLSSCLTSSPTRPLPLHSLLPSRLFSDDAHASHSHGDFLDPHTVEQRVIAVLRNIDRLSTAAITSESTWQQLGLDSLDEVEVVMQLEEEFMVDLYDPDAVRITSVKEAVQAFSTFPFAM